MFTFTVTVASDTDLLERPIAHVAGFVEKFRLERFPNQLIGQSLIIGGHRYQQSPAINVIYFAIFRVIISFIR